MVEVGEICKTCKYYGSFTQSCSYCLWERKSRVRDENGNKIDPAYCNKYIKGKPTYDKSSWGRDGQIR